MLQMLDLSFAPAASTEKNNSKKLVPEVRAVVHPSKSLPGLGLPLLGVRILFPP